MAQDQQKIASTQCLILEQCKKHIRILSPKQPRRKPHAKQFKHTETICTDAFHALINELREPMHSWALVKPMLFHDVTETLQQNQRKVFAIVEEAKIEQQIQEEAVRANRFDLLVPPSDGYGKGIFTSPEKHTLLYEGHFTENQLHGEGFLKNLTTCDHVKGQFVYGKANGQMEYVFVKEVELFRGSVVNDNFHGVGENVFADGSGYRGLFLNDQEHGYGEFYFACGAFYAGEFEHGDFHGQGIFKSSDEEQWAFCGTFRRGFPTIGIVIHPDGFKINVTYPHFKGIVPCMSNEGRPLPIQKNRRLLYRPMRLVRYGGPEVGAVESMYIIASHAEYLAQKQRCEKLLLQESEKPIKQVKKTCIEMPECVVCFQAVEDDDVGCSTFHYYCKACVAEYKYTQCLMCQTLLCMKVKYDHP